MSLQVTALCCLSGFVPMPALSGTLGVTGRRSLGSNLMGSSRLDPWDWPLRCFQAVLLTEESPPWCFPCQDGVRCDIAWQCHPSTKQVPQDLGSRSTHITAGWAQWLPVNSYITTRLEGSAFVLNWTQQGPEMLTEAGREVF